MISIPGGGYLLLSSTVAWKRGLMYDRYQALHANDDEKELCWFAPSRTMHPALPESFIAEEIAKDPVRANAEYLGIFREDSSNLVPANVYDGCVDWGVFERPPVPGIKYYDYTDPALGTGSDSYSLAIGHAEGDKLIIDVIRYREPRFVTQNVIAEWAALLKSYGLTTIRGDPVGGGMTQDEWARAGITYYKHSKTSSELFLASIAFLTSQRARVLEHARTRHEYVSLERRVSLTGHENVGHPQVASAHDDCALAVAGCLYEIAMGKKLEIPITTGFGPVFGGPVVDFPGGASRGPPPGSGVGGADAAVTDWYFGSYCGGWNK